MSRPSFYRHQAERLTAIAAAASDTATRLELLGIAANFQKLADYASANRNLAEEKRSIAPNRAD